MLGKYVWECAIIKSNVVYFLKYRSKVGDNYTIKKGKTEKPLALRVLVRKTDSCSDLHSPGL